MALEQLRNALKSLAIDEFSKGVSNEASPDPDVKIGMAIIKLFGLKQDKNTGYVNTTGGTKSPIGVSKTVKRIIEEGGSGSY